MENVGKGLRGLCGQLVLLQKVQQRGQGLRRADAPVHRRPGDNGHADSHALTVGNGKVPAGFDSVAHRMAEVQKSTLAPVKFIALHHVPLGGHAHGEYVL